MTDLSPIRPAVELDIVQIVSIEKRSFPNPWNTDLLLHHIEQQQSGRVFFPVYVVDSDILGYAIGEHYHPEIHVTNLAVESGHRREGIGTILVGSLIHWAESQNACEIWLEVRESNKSAQAMYQHMGFSISGRRRLYYMNPREDALLMFYSLDARGD